MMYPCNEICEMALRFQPMFVAITLVSGYAYITYWYYLMKKKFWVDSHGKKHKYLED